MTKTTNLYVYYCKLSTPRKANAKAKESLKNIHKAHQIWVSLLWKRESAGYSTTPGSPQLPFCFGTQWVFMDVWGLWERL